MVSIQLLSVFEGRVKKEGGQMIVYLNFYDDQSLRDSESCILKIDDL